MPRLSFGALSAGFCTAATLLICQGARADEGGVGFWLPGQFGSLAAVPQQPGWSFADAYYHTSVSAGGGVAGAREFELGAFSRTATVSLNATLNSRVDVDLISPSYVFATPVLGGQLALGMTGLVGYNSTSIAGTLTVSIGNLTATRVGSIGDDRGGFAIFTRWLHSVGTAESTIS
jgi:hypothetical protein